LGFKLKRNVNLITNPQCKDDHINNLLSYLNLSKQKLNKAKNLLIKGLKSNSKYELFWAVLGSVFYHLEDYQKSIKCFLKTIEINKENIDNWIDLGFSYRANGNFKKIN
jgi:tetratricopeptide (TPR) repeat protein